MKHDKTLDGIRGLAILWVLSFHLFSMPLKPAFLAHVPVLDFVASYGWAGVSLFFVLSGYLITKGLIEANKGKAWFKRFWCRRVFRIVPLYVVLLLTYGVGSFLARSSSGITKQWFSGSIPLWSYLIFAQNLFMASAGYLGNDWLRVTWSLALEEQFYLFISLFIFLVPMGKSKRWILLLICGSLLFRYSIFFTQSNSQTAVIVLLPSRLDGFLLGALLAFSDGYFDTNAFMARYARAGMLLAMAFSIGFVLLLGSGRFGGASLFFVPLYHSAIAIGCSALLGLGLGPGMIWLKRILQAKPLIVSGKVSYFLYLFHMPVCMVLYYEILGSAPNLASASAMLVMLLVIVVLYGLAALSFIYLERPLIAFSKTLYNYPGSQRAEKSSCQAGDPVLRIN
jgi:peptidoglycan/LPS O-acetylase OafA/YrhL